jgi:hypothetical protein
MHNLSPLSSFTVALMTAHTDQADQHDITKALADTLNDALNDEVARAKAAEAALDSRALASEVSICQSFVMVADGRVQPRACTQTNALFHPHSIARPPLLPSLRPRR